MPQRIAIEYLTLSALSRRAGVNRAVPMRLLAGRQLEPDAFVRIGDEPQPLFLPDRAIELVRLKSETATPPVAAA